MTETAAPTAAKTPSAAGTITIDGVTYVLDQLSEEARTQIANLRGCDLEIARLKQQLAITQTAWMAYAAALKQALPQT